MMQVKIEGDIHQGVAYYKKALLYNWHYADAMYNLGVAYGELLKFDMVIVHFQIMCMKSFAVFYVRFAQHNLYHNVETVKIEWLLFDVCNNAEWRLY